MLLKSTSRKVTQHTSSAAISSKLAQVVSKGKHPQQHRDEEEKKEITIPKGLKGAMRPKRSQPPIQMCMISPNPEDGKEVAIKKTVPELISPLTLRLIKEHGDDVLGEMMMREKEKNNSLCLLNHSISPALRAKMINWIIEVTNTFDCEHQTFFLSIAILDTYLKQTKRY